MFIDSLMNDSYKPEKMVQWMNSIHPKWLLISTLFIYSYLSWNELQTWICEVGKLPIRPRDDFNYLKQGKTSIKRSYKSTYFLF